MRTHQHQIIHTGCENWEPLPPFPDIRLLYGTNLTGSDERGAKGLIPISVCEETMGTTVELFGTKAILATAGTAGGVTDLGFVNEGEKTFAPGLSLDSYKKNNNDIQLLDH